MYNVEFKFLLMLGESDGNSKLTLMKVSCILSYIISSVLSRNLKLQLSGFLPYTFHAPFSLYHSNKTYWKSFWGNFILKIEKYSGMSILAPFASASLLSFFYWCHASAYHSLNRGMFRVCICVELSGRLQFERGSTN